MSPTFAGTQTDQFLRKRSYPIGVRGGPTKVHPHVAAIGPTQVRKRLRERGEARLPYGIVFVVRQEHADAPHAVALLRPRHRRPRHRTPQSYDELPPPHWITSSASAISLSGISRPSALAVFLLMTSSNLVGWNTGRSAGLSPLRMRPA
jgi:hypothetical protein